VAALRAVADVLSSQPGGDDQHVAVALRRDAGLLAAALGQPAILSGDRATGEPHAVETAGDAIENALLLWIAGVRDGDPEQTAGSLLDIGLALAPEPGARAEAIPLLARAAARARLGGGSAARRVGAAAWQAAPGVPALAGISDVPAVAGGLGADPWSLAVRAARAGFSDGPMAVVLDLEHGLAAELEGKLGQALDAYARVLAIDGERLEAMEGIRRVAHTAGDLAGEARALARLATLVRRSSAAAEMFSESARLFEQSGRIDDAMALHWHALALRPEDENIVERLSALLSSDLDSPGRAAGFDRLLGLKLGRLRPDGPARIPLLLQRGLNRLHRLNQRGNAIQDFKRILNIAPENEDALRELSAVALTDAAPGEAVELLQRYLSVVRDDALAAQARLDLARAYEASQDIGQAIEILHQASSVRPADGQPRQQLSELSLRAGDWHSAVDTLRAWEQTVSEPARKAQLHLRVGALLRDYGNDPRGAAMSFQLAATLDPMGDGAFALISLYEGLGDSSRRHDVIRGQIIEIRRSLERDPVDVARLRRLRDLLEREAAGPPETAGAPRPTPAAAVPVKQILALFGEVSEVVETVPAPRPMMGPGPDGPDFWAHLASPGAAGFLAEVWSALGEAAARTFPADANKLGLSRQTRITSAAEPRLAWVETSAAALGLTTLAYHVSAHPMGQGDAEVLAVELPEPALVFDRAALAGGMGARFRFGRALALLHVRASLLDRGDAPELRQLFLAGKALGASPGAPVDAGAPVSLVKALGKVMGRKEKKALGSLAQRFENDPLDAPAWQHAVLRTADRLGLVVAGDVAAALRVIVDFNGQVPVAEQLSDSIRALELLRFALSERYLKLRQQVGLGAP
jgi:tetratricopeptide (TPR) repeat protein